MRTKIVVLLSLATLLALPFAYGQQEELELAGKIPFQFTASGKVLPAGEYRFVAPAGKLEVVRVTPAGKRESESVVVAVITRLAGGIHTSRQDAHIVFDVVGNTHILSEIWGATGDGFLLESTNQMHQHRIVDIPR